jgi:hypothetical protein
LLATHKNAFGNLLTWPSHWSVGGFVCQNLSARNFVALCSVAAAEESFKNWQGRLIVRAAAVLDHLNDGILNFSIIIVSDLLKKLM